VGGGVLNATENTEFLEKNYRYFEYRVLPAHRQTTMASSELGLLAALERKFAKSKASNFLGTARVRLSQLEFPNPIRPFDKKLILALKRDFKAEGCLQHERDCSIPAMINDSGFAHVLENLNINSENFKATTAFQPAKFELPDNIQLHCLHGRHRTHAATQYLPIKDRWWLVDFVKRSREECAECVFREESELLVY
jgi:hypothetical protein